MSIVSFLFLFWKNRIIKWLHLVSLGCSLPVFPCKNFIFSGFFSSSSSFFITRRYWRYVYLYMADNPLVIDDAGVLTLLTLIFLCFELPEVDPPPFLVL